MCMDGCVRQRMQVQPGLSQGRQEEWEHRMVHGGCSEGWLTGVQEDTVMSPESSGSKSLHSHPH